MSIILLTFQIYFLAMIFWLYGKLYQKELKKIDCIFIVETLFFIWSSLIQCSVKLFLLCTSHIDFEVIIFFIFYRFWLACLKIYLKFDNFLCSFFAHLSLVLGNVQILINFHLRDGLWLACFDTWTGRNIESVIQIITKNKQKIKLFLQNILTLQKNSQF